MTADRFPVTGGLPAPTDGVAVSRALPFAAISGYRPLELDLHRPVTDRLLPAVVYLHGGGWRQGARDLSSPAFRDWRPGLLTRLAAAGFAVVAPDYRLSGEARFPAQLEDVYRALDWVAANGAGHGIDPDRVLLWGDSAGGHLAALAAMGRQPRPQIRAVVAWYPITDLENIQADAQAIGGEPHNTADARETALLGAPIQDRPDEARDASPVAHVTQAAAPFFLAHGTADLMVPYVQSTRLRDALLAAGKEATLHPVEGADHMWKNATNEQLHHLLNATLTFLTHHATPTTAAAAPTPAATMSDLSRYKHQGQASAESLTGWDRLNLQRHRSPARMLLKGLVAPVTRKNRRHAPPRSILSVVGEGVGTAIALPGRDRMRGR